jgi:hypothetical protein
MEDIPALGVDLHNHVMGLCTVWPPGTALLDAPREMRFADILHVRRGDGIRVQVYTLRGIQEAYGIPYVLDIRKQAYHHMKHADIHSVGARILRSVYQHTEASDVHVEERKHAHLHTIHLYSLFEPNAYLACVHALAWVPHPAEDDAMAYRTRSQVLYRI